MADKPLGECPNGHDLTENDISRGVCPVCSESLFAEKQAGEDG